MSSGVRGNRHQRQVDSLGYFVFFYTLLYLSVAGPTRALLDMCVYYYRKRSGSTAFAPLDLRKAIERGHYDAVKRMITWNRYLMHCPSGRTADYPIHVAVQSGNQRIVKLLLNRGADPNARNAHRKTPMHQCVLHCRHHIIGQLVSHGADLNATDGSNNTPLDLATLLNEK